MSQLGSGKGGCLPSPIVYHTGYSPRFNKISSRFATMGTSSSNGTIRQDSAVAVLPLLNGRAFNDLPEQEVRQ